MERGHLSRGFGATMERDHLFQGNKGYFGINLREQGIALLPRGTFHREHFTRQGRKSGIFKRSMEQAIPLGDLQFSEDVTQSVIFVAMISYAAIMALPNKARK